MICEKSLCTGCFACYNICPQNAIDMKEDNLGYIYPVINQEKCTNCGLCKKICPSINKQDFIYPKKCYASCSNNEKIRKESTSGGVATVFSTYIINHGGIVYGACFENDGSVKHIRVDNLTDLNRLKGSKYVHSYINNTFKFVKQDLLSKKIVLFIGTPCQIAGLKKFLIKDYEQLYLVDLICHGVPSQRFLRDEMKEELGNCEIDNISFRSIDGFYFQAIKDGRVLYKKIKELSPYFDGFMNALFYRENCYTCLYARPERISDITIGDFWGLKNDSKLYNNKDKGVSVCLPITDKGIELIKNCEKELLLEERDINEAVNGNSQLRMPSVKNNNEYNNFKKYYVKYGFYKAYKKATVYTRFKRKIKKNKIINKIYKALKGDKNE